MWHIYILTQVDDNPEGYTGVDCGEGPWKTKEAALDFARSEVGVPWVVIKRRGASRR